MWGSANDVSKEIRTDAEERSLRGNLRFDIR